MFDLVRPFNGTTFSVLDRALSDFVAPRRAWSVPTMEVPADVVETKDAIEVRMDMPGINAEDIRIDLEDDVLTVKVERKLADAEGETYHRSERFHGQLARAFSLPTSVDGGKTAARYDAGVLTITLPKREEAKPRTIAVKVGK